mmetsp:Transcript_8557/g.20217  ORF Transcript_8557/g.20217 Transcript_8557/m.20217 type:complete len:186 (+) Transcript_8557:214-771(+)
MASLNVKVLEADLRCIEPYMPQTFPSACERATTDVHLFASVRVIQSTGSSMHATFVKDRTCKPVWEEEFTLIVEEARAELEVVVYDWNKNGHRFVGSVVVQLSDIEQGDTVDEWYPLRLHPQIRPQNGQLPTPEPTVRVQITLSRIRFEPLPPRPPDFLPQYRLPSRVGYERGVCCANPLACPVS